MIVVSTAFRVAPVSVTLDARMTAGAIQNSSRPRSDGQDQRPQQPRDGREEEAAEQGGHVEDRG